MASDVLNSLLKEYEQKKINAEIDLEKRKQNLYKLIPRLQEIDDELSTYAINTAKNILNNNANNNSIADLKQKISDLKKEKELILKENNYSLNFLTPNYECRKCGDTGFIVTDNYKTTMCNCLKQKLLDYSFNNSNLSNIKEENFNTFNELLFSDEVDLAKYRFNISPRKNISNIKQKCIEFIENFDNSNTKNLLFVGPTGLR